MDGFQYGAFQYDAFDSDNPYAGGGAGSGSSSSSSSSSTSSSPRKKKGVWKGQTAQTEEDILAERERLGILPKKVKATIDSLVKKKPMKKR